MKTISNYFKYLAKKPFKLLWIAFVNLFIFFFGYYVITGDLDVTNEGLVKGLLLAFDFILFAVSFF